MNNKIMRLDAELIFSLRSRSSYWEIVYTLLNLHLFYCYCLKTVVFNRFMNIFIVIVFSLYRYCPGTKLKRRLKSMNRLGNNLDNYLLIILFYYFFKTNDLKFIACDFQSY